MNYIKETEKWLYNYKTMMAGIENLYRLYEEKEKEAQEGHPIRYDRDKLSPTYVFSSETENIALDLVIIKSRIEKMKVKVKNIETALETLNDAERMIIEMKYFEGCRWQQISYKAQYNERWCKEIRKRAIEKMAIGMFGETQHDYSTKFG
ncbi:hypothetical protein OXPF_05970 [Oxobacter pfennigii]|uniref:Uncharacterized protein n=1 Tax=Oxobacter pfennigii TaxID=36849 RepID=A0A0N8NTU5_9CLOT|nr:sigma-70 family RNA polymerase sigma factor [Oxobacter pfennigii]KPU45808.1 hypothetical protein OXPF_05970 [Oxobacter pfennigii]